VRYSLGYNEPTMLPVGGRHYCGCIIPQDVTHGLVLLKMSKIIARIITRIYKKRSLESSEMPVLYRGSAVRKG